MSEHPTDDFSALAGLVALDGRRVLDVGCGTGWLVRRLAQAGADATGLEISDAQLAGAIERDPKQAARYVVGRAEALPLADASVDVVVFMKSLHHVPADTMPAALREAGRVVRPGGAVYVAEPEAAGSFYELTRLAEDESLVRRLAQEAVACSELADRNTVRYEVRPAFADYAAFRRLLLDVDPARAGVLDERDVQLRAAFAEHADHDAATGDHVFVQPMRADVLQRGAADH